MNLLGLGLSLSLRQIEQRAAELRQIRPLTTNRPNPDLPLPMMERPTHTATPFPPNCRIDERQSARVDQAVLRLRRTQDWLQ